MKKRDEGTGSESADPFCRNRSTTLIGRLVHHVETRNRKPAGTSMAVCVSPIRSRRPTTRARREAPHRDFPLFLFPFFFHGERVRAFTHRYALSYPREFRERFFLSRAYSPRFAFYVPTFVRRYPARNLRWFCIARRFCIVARLPDVAAHSSRKIACCGGFNCGDNGVQTRI